MERPLVEPKQTGEKNVNCDEALEMERSYEEEKAKKKVSFSESFMPFEKPTFKSQVPLVSNQMQKDMQFQQVYIVWICYRLKVEHNGLKTSTSTVFHVLFMCLHDLSLLTTHCSYVMSYLMLCK